MAVYVLVSGLFYFGLLCLFLHSYKNRPAKIDEKLFIDKSHTETIKGIAAIGIVISHFAAKLKRTVAGISKYYVLVGTSLGGMGVNLFFFASGYGNYYSARKLKEPRDKLIWLGRRIANILVVYLVCFFLSTLTLSLAGKVQTVADIQEKLFSLKMPLATTWYLKIQLLLYVILTVTLFISNSRVRSVVLIGLSFALTVVFYLGGFSEEWWKSTMCFTIGYFAAEYKVVIFQFVNKYKKQLWWTAWICFPVLYMMANPLDNFFVKTVGNAFLMIAMMIIVEVLNFHNRVLSQIGAYSLEIYLIHTSMNAWFMDGHISFNVGIICVIALTAILSMVAKPINRKLTIK